MKMRIVKLKADTTIGVHSAERKVKRKVEIDLTITYDAAVRDDDIKETLDYAEIEKNILTSVAKQKCKLLESLAEHVAHLVLAMERVQEVTVLLGKPGALKNAETVVVEYHLKK